MPTQDSALIGWAARRLADAGIESPRREARLLLSHALGPDGGSMPPQAAFEAAVARRVAREPMAYITGSQGFWTLELAVSPATLIPRADSEALVESLLRQRGDRTRPMRMLDLGTGTGCLLLACLSEFPSAWGLGVDIAAPACALAAANARRNGLSSRSSFVCGNWSDALALPGCFDLVLSNPPYIGSAAIDGLMVEVGRYEPRRALDGGVDSLDAYRLILGRLGGLLTADGIAILELGAGQAEAVCAIAEASGLVLVSLYPDLGAIDRALTVRLPSRG